MWVSTIGMFSLPEPAPRTRGRVAAAATVPMKSRRVINFFFMGWLGFGFSSTQRCGGNYIHKRENYARQDEACAAVEVMAGIRHEHFLGPAQAQALRLL